MNKLFKIIPFMVLLLTSIGLNAQSRTEQLASVSGKISVAGSDTLAQIVSVWAQQFSLQYPKVKFQLQASGSSSAPIALVEGTSILVTMSRQMTAKERERFVRDFGYPPLEIPIAIDALAVFVNQLTKNCYFKSPICVTPQLLISGEGGMARPSRVLSLSANPD